MSELHRRAADAPEPASAAPERAAPDRRTDDDRSDTPGTLRSHTDFAEDTRDQIPEPDKAKDKPDRNTRLTVDGKPIHEYLDPVGAGARSNTIGDRPPDKHTGDHIAEADSDDKPHRDQLRKKLYKAAGSERKAMKESGHLWDALDRPTGHPVVGPRPVMDRTPQTGIPAGDAFVGFAVAGAMIGEAIRMAGKHRRERMGNRADDH